MTQLRDRALLVRQFSRRMAFLALFVALSITATPPFFYAWLTHTQLEEEAQLTAHYLSADIAESAVRQPLLWRYKVPKVIAEHLRPTPYRRLSRVRILGCSQQKTLASWTSPEDTHEGPLAWSPIQRGERLIGWVEVSMDQHPGEILLQRLALGSLFFGILLGSAVYLLPTRIVSRQARQLAQADENLMRSNEDLQRRITLAVGEIRALSGQIVDTQEKERARIARDLHDGVGQLLTGLRFTLERAHPIPTQALDLCMRTLNEIKQIVHNLQPAELDTQSLSEALRDLCARFEEQTGIATSFRHRGGEVEEEDLARCLLRVCQESLTNAGKHAECSEIGVVLTISSEKITLEVSDDGAGFDSDAVHRGSGLPGMKQRVALLQGEFSLQSSPEEGTSIVSTFHRKKT